MSFSDLSFPWIESGTQPYFVLMTLYIFGDIHLETQSQTECIYNDKYDSMDIDKFLLSFIRNNKSIKYDIFTEIGSRLFHKHNQDTNYYYKNLPIKTILFLLILL